MSQARTDNTGEAAATDRVPPRRRDWTAVVIALLCFVVYMANWRSIDAGDTYPARYLPFAFWRSHSVTMDSIADIAAQGQMPTPVRKPGAKAAYDWQRAFWMIRLDDGHIVSRYPIVAPLLVAPLYLPAVTCLDAEGWEPERFDRVSRIMEKVSASIVAALSAVFLYLALRRRLAPRPAFLLTVAYAFGTTTWTISSQALWQHGPGELLVAAALLLLTGPCTRWRALATGCVLCLLAFNRPPDVFISAAFGLYALRWARRDWPVLVAGGLLPGIPLLFYNVGVVGNVVGGYALAGSRTFFEHNVLTGIAGLLFSPAKGLLVFSPFLAFVPFCVPRILRDGRTRALGIAILCAAALQLLLYGVADWRQGVSWGPRWLTDLLPLFIWILIPVVSDFGKIARAVFALAVGVAVVIEAIGAFYYVAASDVIYDTTATPDAPMRPLWKWANAPFFVELEHAHAPFELSTEVRGVVDLLKTDYGADGREIRIEGWAAAEKRTPAEVVLRIDGHVAARITTFAPRPDVSAALGVEGPSGWLATIPARGMGAGEHVLVMLVRANEGGFLSLVAERKFTIRVPSGSGLAYSSSLAADILANRQHASGYWLTSYTSLPRFEQPHTELNTYVPAVIVDVLGPVADDAGLGTHIANAKRFLSSQIESDGLVRYHGLPDAPTIGTLGCVITPDADDTALAWRLAANPPAERMANALRTLGEFRTADGLYRTWLATRDRYRCIDPGSDPDPADIGIQLHVLMWLAQVDPPAATVLCRAVEHAIDEDRVWVYYKLAPLIPVLREADARELGCAVHIPRVREQTEVPEQASWIAGARMLDGLRAGGPSAPDPHEVRAWLQNVAADEFASVRRAPPLLYHNDLTASVQRYYWSEEFGYALWLRVYFQSGQAKAGSSD
ncbi:MAG TPA: hypothetical protein VFB32_06730 [Rudaea sp.]|nr:hypothetical protein [Rudaea sp.]